MSNNAHDKAAQEEHFADIFARLREQDIEQFYAHYQLWVLRRRLPLIENQLEALREHLAENQQVTESLRPSALALAVLVRLQSNGVNDTDVLDLMLDRGEDWLDHMMQRLDYCEQVEDFIQGDYNQWCIKSLEGAYDWIDSLLGSIKEDNGHTESSERYGEAIEELLLQKLSQDDEEAMLEVTLKQSVAPLEAPTESSEIISTEPSPASELEAGSALDEQSEPELPLQSDAAAELQAKSELEQQSELIGWKDLEDLEAPEEQPVPWYSIDVTEDGTTSVSDGTRQTVTMNDWITILHADVHASKEANTTEAPTDETAEMRSAIDSAEATEIHIPAPASAGEVTEQAEEMADLSVNHAEVVELQDESETISPVNADQEQSTPARTESQNGEISSGASEILVDEMPNPEMSVAAEVSTPTEIPASEANKSESTFLVDGNRLAHIETNESSCDENETSVEKVREEAEQSAPESANQLEEYIQVVSEQETDPLKQPEEAQAAPTTDEIASTEAFQTSVTDLPPTETETEGAEIEPSLADLPPSENVPTEFTEAQMGDEQTEDMHLHAVGSEEQPGIHKDDHTRQIEKEIQGNEIEIAAISNDIISGEEGQEEQLAWYEYLELEEPVSNTVSNRVGERIEPEKAGDTSLDKPVANGTAASDIDEYVAVEESKREQNSPLHPENEVTEEALESENWQSWDTTAGEEETLPLVLKEIQHAQHSSINNAQSGIVNEVVEPRDELESTIAEVQTPDPIMENSQAGAQTGHSESETSVGAEEANGEAGSEEVKTAYPEISISTQTKDVSTKSEEYLLRQTTDIAEQPTLMMDKIPQMSRESLGTGQIVHRGNTPASTQFTQSAKVEQPPKKVGFWRRLFSFGRKKKQ